jgi:hypothetical protein
MTVLSLRWLLARPRRRTTVTRSRWPAIVTRSRWPAIVTRSRWPAIVTRSRWPAIVTRRRGPARRPAPPERRPYPDLFFADPAAVEDDSRRMRQGTGRRS